MFFSIIPARFPLRACACPSQYLYFIQISDSDDVCPVLQILTPFQTKKCHFQHPFSDVGKVTKGNVHVYIDRSYVIITEIRRPTKLFLKIHCHSHVYSFLFIYLELKHYTTVVPQFQTKMGKNYTRFRTQTAQTPYPLGRHMPMWLI